MLENFLRENDLKGWNLKAVIFNKDEETVFNHYRVDKDTLLPQYSITKAFTAAAIGILVDCGALSLDDRISLHIPEIINSGNERLQQVSIRHLLSNSSGTSKGYLFEADRFSHGTDDYLDLIIGKELSYRPGEMYVYSNSNFYLLSRIIGNISGQISDDFIRDNILKPLEITDYRAVRCPQGHFLGGSGLFLKTQDMAKLGIMISAKGLYKGARVLSEDFINLSMSPQIKINSKESYGFAFMMKDTRYAFVPGNYNQLLLIDRKENYVVAVNSEVKPSDTGTLMKIIRRCISNNG